MTKRSLDACPHTVSWSIVLETAALRRDAQAFALLHLSIPSLGKACVDSDHVLHLQHQYFSRYFDDVIFCYDVDDCVFPMDEIDGFKEKYIVYLRNRQAHRAIGPAVEFKNGDRQWYANGLLHRTNGPAVIRANGDMEWWIDNVRHRTDGPAMISCSIGKWWFQHGKKHRIGGPAVEYRNGKKCWYVLGKRHRLNGPAKECASGTKSWFFQGESCSEDGHPMGSP